MNNAVLSIVLCFFGDTLVLVSLQFVPPLFMFDDRKQQNFRSATSPASAASFLYLIHSLTQTDNIFSCLVRFVPSFSALVKYEKWNIKCCISKSTVFFPIVVVYSSFYPFKQTKKLVHRIFSLLLLVFFSTFYHLALFILMSFSAYSFICSASIFFWCSCHSFLFLSDSNMESKEFQRKAEKKICGVGNKIWFTWDRKLMHKKWNILLAEMVFE